jgi:hypothetical protein
MKQVATKQTPQLFDRFLDRKEPELPEYYLPSATQTPRSRAPGWRANWTDRQLSAASRRWWSATTEASSPAMPSWPGRSEPRRMALHRARQAHAERLHRELQRSAAGRIVERDVAITTPRDRTRSSDGRSRLSSPSPANRAGIWRCAMPRAPRQLPSLPPPKRANPRTGADSGLDKTVGQGHIDAKKATRA